MTTQENRAIARQQAEVLTAYADGITTQARKKHTNLPWHELEHTDVDLYTYEIRLKPEPKEIWANYYPPINLHNFHLTVESANMMQDNTTECIREHYLQVMDE